MLPGEFAVRAEDRAEVRQLLADGLRPVQEAVQALGRQLEEGLRRVAAQAEKHAALEATVGQRIPASAQEHAALHARIGRTETLARSIGLLFAGALITAGVAALVRPPSTAPAAQAALEAKLDAIQAQLSRLQQQPAAAPIK